MNGKYVMFYALIVAAMVALLIVSFFDWRLLNCGKPVKPGGPKRNLPEAPTARDRRTQTPVQNREHHRNGHRPADHQSKNSNNSQMPDYGNVKSAFIADYIILVDERGNRQVLHIDGRMVENIGLTGITNP